MSVAIVTGSCGLVGSESVRYFAGQDLQVVGIDNNMRAQFFGEEASTDWMRRRLIGEIPSYVHHDTDIRDEQAISRIFETYGKEIVLVVHTAAQPSHDWAANNPFLDFSINATGTQVLLEATRRIAPS